MLLVLAELPDADVARMESGAARTGCLVLAVGDGLQRALAHASSLTFEVEWVGWVQERGTIVGVRSVVRCVENKVATPGSEVELVMRYPLGALQPEMAAPAEVEREQVQGEQWAADSAAG